MPSSALPDRTLLARFGRACHDHRWIVLAVWLVAFFVVGGAVGAAGSGFTTEFSPPDVESARGLEILEKHFGGQGAGMNGQIVFVAEQGVTDPSVQEPMEELFAQVDSLEGDFPTPTVISPYDPQLMGPPQISPDGTIAYATVELDEDTSVEEAAAVAREINKLLPHVDGLRIELGGQVFAEFEPPSSELIGLGFAVFVLILAFGSVLAMGLSIGTALGGIMVGVTSITLLSNVVVMPDFTYFIAVMIGLGVGIDYALFIVTRYREELHAGWSEGDATEIAIDTAGRAVLFAGITVVISLLGMLLMGLSFVNGLAIGAATVVAVTMLASVTLLPALLGFAGNNMETTRWRGLIAACLIAVGLIGTGLTIAPLMLGFPAAIVVLVAGFFVSPLKAEVPRRAHRPIEETVAYRWSRLIQNNPWTAAIVSTVALLVMALPFLSLRLGFSDEGNYPEESTTRQAYDLLAEGFGAGFNGPLMLVSEMPAGTDPAVLAEVSEALAATPGVAFASPGIPNDPEAPTAVLWSVIPETAPQDAATQELVEEIREEVLPAATDGTGLDVSLTGFVGIAIDFSEYIAFRMPLFLGAVLTLSFLLLMMVFRSILVPFKAVIMNLLSICASYGLAVAVFQWGWARELFGVDATGPIEPFIPMMLFAIVFGLSMDYEVFLLSRVKEEYDKGASNGRAVADGLASTARVITAAAAIMVVVFGSFLLETDRVVKLMGFGLGIAVLLDATVVRMVLVPATMELLGDRNWWLPRWLERILPRVNIEGAHREPPSRTDAADGDPDPEPEPEPLPV